MKTVIGLLMNNPQGSFKNANLMVGYPLSQYLVLFLEFPFKIQHDAKFTTVMSFNTIMSS